MKMHAAQWKIEEMANALSVSRSGYYRSCKRMPSRRQQANDELLQALWRIFKSSRETYGSPRIHAELLLQGFSCSRPRVARLMKEADIKAKMQRLFKTTTKRNLKATAALNLLQQVFKATTPNKKWVADRSYVRTLEGWLYIDLLKAHNITCSMSGVGNCYDNAAMESFFHTLKTECVYFERYENREQAKQSIFE